MVSYLKYSKFCLYQVHDARWRDLEIPGGLALIVTIKNQCFRCFKTLIMTLRSGRQRFPGNCTFNDIKSIPSCVGSTPTHVVEVALDHIEIAQAVHQDDSGMSSGVPNTKQPESSWHRVSAATCSSC